MKKMCQKYITVDDTAGTGAALIEVNQITAENRIIVIKACLTRLLLPMLRLPGKTLKIVMLC